MSEFSGYFHKQMNLILELTDHHKYYRKALRRYRDTFSLVYPFLAEGGKTVLDLGGWEMALLSQPLAASVQSVALSSPKEVLRDRFQIPVENLDILAPVFPLENTTFDLIFFLEILEHLPPPTDLVMQRLRRLLNPGGRLVLSLPNLASWQRRAKFFFFGRSPLKLGDERDEFGGYHHIRTYTYGELITLFHRYDFRVLRFRSGNYHRGWHSHFLHLLERLCPRMAHKFIFLAAPGATG